MTDEEQSKADAQKAQDDVKESPQQDAGTQVPEKITLTKQELDNQLANARRKSEAAQKEWQKKYEDLNLSIEAKEKAANDAAAEKVEALRKDLPDSIGKLLDKLTAIEQLEWLSDPENAITKKEIPQLPQSTDGRGSLRKSISVI